MQRQTFFYGLFMAPQERHGLAEPGPSERAYLPDHALLVGRRATLVPCPGARAWGVVERLESAVLARLYGLPEMADYRPRAVTCLHFDTGQAIPALAWIAPPPRILEIDHAYAERLIGCLRARGFPEEAWQWLNKGGSFDFVDGEKAPAGEPSRGSGPGQRPGGPVDKAIRG